MINLITRTKELYKKERILKFCGTLHIQLSVFFVAGGRLRSLLINEEQRRAFFKDTVSIKLSTNNKMNIYFERKPIPFERNNAIYNVTEIYSCRILSCWAVCHNKCFIAWYSKLLINKGKIKKKLGLWNITVILFSHWAEGKSKTNTE